MLVDGDASVMMHLAEFDTMVRYKMPLLIVVLNNEALGSEYYKLDAHKMDKELSVITTPDLGAVAQAFGGKGMLATSIEEVQQGRAGVGRESGPDDHRCAHRARGGDAPVSTHSLRTRRVVNRNTRETCLREEPGATRRRFLAIIRKCHHSGGREPRDNIAVATGVAPIDCSAELRIANLVRCELAPRMRAHDFFVELHACAGRVRNRIIAIHERRVLTDHHVHVALVFRQLMLEDQKVFGHGGDMKARERAQRRSRIVRGDTRYRPAQSGGRSSRSRCNRPRT